MWAIGSREKDAHIRAIVGEEISRRALGHADDGSATPNPKPAGEENAAADGNFNLRPAAGPKGGGGSRTKCGEGGGSAKVPKLSLDRVSRRGDSLQSPFTGPRVESRTPKTPPPKLAWGTLV